MPRRPILIFAGLCVAAAVAIAVAAIVTTTGRASGNGEPMSVATGQPQVGGPFSLVDQEGGPVDESLLRDKWTLVFFGFTYCPDYCPTTLATLDAVQQRLGDKARDLQIVFISVDPARDTPQALKDYLSSDGFPDGVIGLTGTDEQVAAAARVYRAYYEKSGEGEAYTMNHSLTVYLMGPDGRFRTALTHDLAPDRAAPLIERAMAAG